MNNFNDIFSLLDAFNKQVKPYQIFFYNPEIEESLRDYRSDLGKFTMEEINKMTFDCCLFLPDNGR